MVDQGPPSAEEARALIERWGELEERQAGLAGFLDIVAHEGLLLEEPGMSWEGLEGLEDRQLGRRGFFDEQHHYYDVRIAGGEERTVAWTSLKWSARFRPDDSPTSCQVEARLEHTWELRRRLRDGRPVVQKRTVDALAYREGAPTIEEAPAACRPHLPAPSDG